MIVIINSYNIEEIGIKKEDKYKKRNNNKNNNFLGEEKHFYYFWRVWIWFSLFFLIHTPLEHYIIFHSQM